eukprot:gene34513-46316_t
MKMQAVVRFRLKRCPERNYTQIKKIFFESSRVENEYRLIKDLWAFDGNFIAVRFQYEWHDDAGQWFRSYGNEQWEFDAEGLMARREASINDFAIKESERRFHWPAPGPRPADVPGLAAKPF